MKDESSLLGIKGKYCIIRTFAAGVHFGYIAEYYPESRHIKLTSSRRLWYWEGAFTLSAVSRDGVKDAKISVETPEFTILSQVEEVIPCSKEAIEQLSKFKAHEITS